MHPILAYYLVAITVLCIYGLHRYWLVLLCFRGRTVEPRTERFDTLPLVTVQLPMFNERHVAERIITAACALDYPRDRIEIQVLDDSTDASAGIARRCCDRLAESGHDVQYIHRAERIGFKAGALAEGLRSARGELVAVFDADFVPPPEFLRELVHEFTDPEVGMVQARWTHLNRDHSWLTSVQALALDAHFLIEQSARAANRRWFNFNGTAGIWRRRCIDEAGGWEHDTLTEDTDLSYRAQLLGWRFVFRSDVACPAELPPTVSALISQQHRWTKGLVQNAIKLMPRILRSDAALRNKFEAWFHLTGPAPYLFILLLALLAIPAVAFVPPPAAAMERAGLLIGITALGLGTLAAAVYTLAAQVVRERGAWWRHIPAVVALMAVGIGVSLINTKAILEAIFGRPSPFVRTPKFNDARESAADPSGRRRIPRGLLETAVGLGLVITTIAAFRSPFTLVGIPFLVLFAGGFLAVGIPALIEQLRARPRHQPTRVAAGGRSA